MITQRNYFEKVNQIDFDTFPSKVIEMYRYVKEITENHTTWKYYDWDTDIRATVQDYFDELNRLLKTDELEGTKSSKKPRKAYKKREKSKGKNTIAPGQILPEPRQIQSKDPDLVEKVSEEVKFIKRFVTMQGKEKTDIQILAFINALQKAILEKRIRKTSPFAQEIKYIQFALVKLYNKFLTLTPSKRVAKIEIHPTNFKFLSAIAGSEKSRLSVSYLKRYIGIQGKKLSKEKVERLLEALNNAAEKRKLTGSDPYADRLRLVYKSLNLFLKSAKPNDTLEVHPAILNGINEELDGCACCEEKKKETALCGGEPELEAIETGGMSLNAVKQLEFDPVPVEGKWLQLIGKFCLPTSFFIFGRGGSGKSSLALLLCDYLASLGYRCLYIASEQYGTPTFTALVNRLNLKGGKNYDVVASLNDPEKNPADYDFVALDSKDSLNVEVNDYLAIRARYPKQSFIVVPHSIKSGSFRGKEQWRNVMEVMIECKDGIARTGNGEKNRWGGAGEMKIFDPNQRNQAA